MTYRAADGIPTGRTNTAAVNSYISHVPTSTKRTERKTNKTNVKDSLMKFLDDCGNEDLLMAVASPEKKRSNTKNKALSMSEHGPRTSSVKSIGGLDPPKRRGTKKDHLLNLKSNDNNDNNNNNNNNNLRKPNHSLSSSSDHISTSRSLAFARSEHGTHSTEKAALTSLTRRTVQSTDDEEDDSSDNGSFAADDQETSTKSTSRSRSAASKKNERRRSSRSDTTTKDQSRRSKSISSTGRIRRTTSERDSQQRTPRSERTRKKTDVRRTKSESAASAPIHLGQHFASVDHSSTNTAATTATTTSAGRRRRTLHPHHHDDDNRSVSSSRSSFSTVSTRNGKSLGLDAGPLNAFLNAAERRPTSAYGSGSASVGPGIHAHDDEHRSRNDEAYLRLRKERQDEILNQAQLDRWNSKNNVSKTNDAEDVHASLHENGIPSGEDDDQPIVKGRETALKRFKKGISKTGKVTKSTAKGTVNMVRDPKRTARKVGVFAKDVGKETAQMVMHPKLAAKTAVSLGKDVTKGTYKVTKGVGKGVAKGSLGLTKTVAKTGVNATTMVVGTAWDGAGKVMDGAGKVMNGATGLIFKHGHGDRDEEYKDYNASELESRRKTGTTLMDRVSNPSIASTNSSLLGDERAARMNNQSIPTIMVDKHTKQSWDF